MGQQVCAVQTGLEADERDRRFVAQFEEIRLIQSQRDQNALWNLSLVFTDLQKAFQEYGLALGTLPVEQAVDWIGQRPEPMRKHVLAALDVCLFYGIWGQREDRQWFAAVLEAAETDPWRAQVCTALPARDGPTLTRLVQEVEVARQPAAFLLLLAQRLPLEARPMRRRCCVRFSRPIRATSGPIMTSVPRWPRPIRPSGTKRCAITPPPSRCVRRIPRCTPRWALL